jgi:membrane protease YdiL (CAAX protease family)
LHSIKPGHVVALVILLGLGAAMGLSAASQPYNARVLVTVPVLMVLASGAVVLITLGDEQPDWRLPKAKSQIGVYVLYEVLVWPISLLAFALQKGSPEVVTPFLDTQNYASAFFLKAGVPVLLLTSGAWCWPQGLRRPGLFRLAPVAVLATAVVLIEKTWPDSPEPAWSLGLQWLWNAAAEELVFRVILLSCLCTVLRSRLAALLLSSVIFGAVHIPNAYAEGAVSEFWQVDFVTALPLLIVWDGLFYGVLWLRTRSFVLVTVIHAVSNFGEVAVG